MKLHPVNSTPLTPATDVLVPYAGHYHRKSAYHVLRPSGTRDWLLIYTRSGEGICRVSPQTLRLTRGDLLLIEPGFLHDYGLPGPEGSWELLWVHFVLRPEWGLLVQEWPEVKKGYRKLKLSPNARASLVKNFTRTIRNASAHTSYHDLVAMHEVEKLLLSVHIVNPRRSVPVLDARLLRVTQYIQLHLDAPLNLDSLADQSGISKFRLAHLFRQQLGISPHKFILNERLRKSCDLLEATNLTMAEIAFRTGFSSPAHFGDQFKRRMRKSPGAYRSGKRPDDGM